MQLWLFRFLVLLTTATACCCRTFNKTWAMTSLSGCDSSCRRSPQFRCFRANDNSLVELPDTSPRLMVAMTTDGALNDAECNGIQKPPKWIANCSSSQCSGGGTPDKGSSRVYNWEWDFSKEIRCVAECNQPGVVHVSLKCVDSSGGTVPDSRCRLPRPPPTSLGVPCYRFNNCGSVWKAAPWGQCSRQCGLGEMERSVDCRRLTDSVSGPFFRLTPGECSHLDQRPHAKEFCVVNAKCKPYYRITMAKCTEFASMNIVLCNETGRAVTRAVCVRLRGDLASRSNKTERTGDGDCRAAGLKKPHRYTPCRIDDATLKRNGVRCVNDPAMLRPRFRPVDSVLVQMERQQRQIVYCGQTGTIIPGTDVLLRCRVVNYKPANLIWRRLTQTAALPKEGDANCGRVCATQGELRIGDFTPDDAGVYEVSAGSVTARVILHWHSAYDAYVNAYLPRLAHLHSGQTRTGRPGVSAQQHDRPSSRRLVWMLGAWSECSIVCGGNGSRNRSVRCELLEKNSYTVVPDSKCVDDGLGQRPADTAKCGQGECPVWHIGEWSDDCPVSRCYLAGYSLSIRTVKCVDRQGRTLMDRDCRNEVKPDRTRRCENRQCKPQWKAGDWSRCSVSCGGHGYRTRSMSCQWMGTDSPAGLACENFGLTMPKAVESCFEGACERLGCVDLSPVCKIYQASGLCAHLSLRRDCCHTCSLYAGVAITRN